MSDDEQYAIINFLQDKISFTNSEKTPIILHGDQKLSGFSSHLYDLKQIDSVEIDNLLNNISSNEIRKKAISRYYSHIFCPAEGNKTLEAIKDNGKCKICKNRANKIYDRLIEIPSLDKIFITDICRG